MSNKSPRRLVVGDDTFRWTMRWSYDRDGERIVHLSITFSDGERRRGQPLFVRFLSRAPEYPAPSCIARPGDVRAALDLGRALGWTGARARWLLPADGLERPDLVVSTPTRLREWLGQRPFYRLYLYHPIAAPLAAALAIPPVPESLGGDELQWRDDRRFILDNRFGHSATVYTQTVADLADTLRAAHRVAPGASASAGGLPAKVHGPGLGELPAADIVPPAHWSTVPGATRYPGARPNDAVYIIETPGGPRIENYHHHPNSDRLWSWTTLAPDGTILERRFR